MRGGLKTLSSREVISIFAMFGFEIHSQKGSHIKLRRYRGGVEETLIVPERREIPKGTLRGIFKQACAFIPLLELHPHFYHEK